MIVPTGTGEPVMNGTSALRSANYKVYANYDIETLLGLHLIKQCIYKLLKGDSHQKYEKIFYCVKQLHGLSR